MPDFSALDIPPPKNWQDFETLCCELWKLIWEDPNAQKHGRSGQKQTGVDIFGLPNGKWAGVQCKLKNNSLKTELTAKEINDEVENAKKFHSPLSDLAIATTAPRDAKAQKLAGQITNKHLKRKQKLFPVTIYSWDDILDEIKYYPFLIIRYCPWVLGVAQGAIDFYENSKSLESLKAPLEEIKQHIDSNPLFPDDIDEEIIQEAEEDVVEISTQPPLLPSEMPVAPSVLQATEDLSVTLNQVKKLVDDYRPGTALEILHKVKSRFFPTQDNQINFRILALQGNALFMLQKEREAGEALLEAYSYDPTNEKAIKNKALALCLLGKKRQAKAWIDKIFDVAPNDEFGYQLLVQAANKSETFEEVHSKVPEGLRNESSIAFALGVVARRKNDFKRAQHYLEQSINTNKKSALMPKGELATLLAERVLEDPQVRHYGYLTDYTRQLFNQSIQLFTESWDSIQDVELQKTKIYWLVNKANVNRILDNLTEAKEQVEVALSLVPDYQPAIKLFALINFELGEPGANIELLKKIQDDPEGPILLAEALRMSNRQSEAIELLESYASQKVAPKGFAPVDLINVKRLLNQLYIDQGKLEESNKLTESFLKENPKGFSNILERGRYFIKLGNPEEANKALIQAEKSLTYNSSYKMRLDLAHAFYEVENYELAAELYGGVVHTYKDDLLTNRFLRSLYNAGFENKALEICQIIRASSGPAEFITEIEAVIYADIGDLPKAKEIIQEYLVKYPGHLSMQIRLAFINLHTFNFAELDSYLNSGLPEDVRLDFGFHLVYFLKNRGMLFEALDRLYNLRKKYYNDNQAHLKYIGYIFEQDEKIDPYIGVQQIGLGTAFCLQTGTDEKEWFIVEKDAIADYRNNEIGESHPLAKAVLGKKVGDLIHIEPAPKKTITEIKSKYLYAFHESLRLYENFFPGDQSFQRVEIHIPDNPKEKREGVETIFDKVSELNEYRQKAEGLYKKGNLTIGALARLLNRHAIETWGGLLADRELKIKCCIGNDNERQDTLQSLDSKPTLAVDITSLLTLNQLDALDTVVSFYGKLAITQSTLDDILGFIEEKKGIGSRGYLTLSKEGDDFYKTEITPEQIANQVSYLERLVQWIRDNCTVIPCRAALNFNRKQHLKLYEVIGQSFIDTALIAQEPGNILFSDDLYLRSLARNEFNAKGTWTQAVLFYLMEVGHITKPEYSELVSKLLDLNYSYIFLNDFILLHKLEKAEWSISEPFIRLCDIIFGSETELFSAMRVLLVFYAQLWTKPVTAENKEEIIHFTLSRLLDGKDQKSEILDVMIKAIVRSFSKVPFTRMQILNFIQSWMYANPDVRILPPNPSKEFKYPWFRDSNADRAKGLTIYEGVCAFSTTVVLTTTPETTEHFVQALRYVLPLGTQKPPQAQYL